MLMSAMGIQLHAQLTDGEVYEYTTCNHWFYIGRIREASAPDRRPCVLETESLAMKIADVFPSSHPKPTSVYLQSLVRQKPIAQAAKVFVG